MAYYIRNSNIWRVTDQAALDIHTKLPNAIFMLRIDQFGAFYLEQVDDFPTPSKIYGDYEKTCEKMMRTFWSRQCSTGIMLSGEKGSGKTLLARMLGQRTVGAGHPVIIIDAPFFGSAFNKFVQDIDQPAMMLFDEFEKVYDENQQGELLTLLDGVFQTRKLFVLTCNDKWRVNKHMHNRPGRLYYMKEFGGLEQQFIREYCEDALDDKSHIDNICQIAGMYYVFSFDMLKALVEEMNRYNESPSEALELLNAKPEYSSKSKFDVEIYVNGTRVQKDLLQQTEWTGNPLVDDGIVYRYKDSTHDDYDENIFFEPRLLVSIDGLTGKFTYNLSDNVTVILTKTIQHTINFLDYAKAF